MKRERVLDFLRGIAIPSMILTHVISLIYSGDNQVLDYALMWGVNISYPVFLFAFAFIYGRKLEAGKFNWQKELKRALAILGIYLLLAFYVNLFLNTTDYLDLLLIKDLPEYVDFLPAFAFYIPLLPLVWRLTKRAPYLSLVLSLAVSIGAIYVSGWSSGYAILDWFKTHLVGMDGIHAFSVASYLPVVTLAYVISMVKKDRQKALVSSIIVSGLLFLALIPLGLYEWHRWPMYPGFMLAGIVPMLGFMWVFEYIKESRIVQFIEEMGSAPMHYYLWHIIILVPLSQFISPMSPSEFMVIVIYLVIMSMLYISNRLSLNDS